MSAISPNASRPARRAGRVHDDAHGVPAGLAELRLGSRGLARAGRTVRRRPRQRHPDARHAGLRRRPGRPSVPRRKNQHRRSDVQIRPDDGTLAPSFDAAGTTLAFSSTAANLVFGDNNTPPGGERDAEDGADVFPAGITFAFERTGTDDLGAPPNPAADVPWKLGVTAQSLRNGRVRLYLGAGHRHAARRPPRRPCRRGDRRLTGGPQGGGRATVASAAAGEHRPGRPARR